MAQPAEPLPATCRDCGRSSRVATSHRSRPCEDCGGVLVVNVRSEGAGPVAPVREGAVTCEECQAINPGGTEYCVECGTSLPPSRAHPGSTAARRIRHEAQGALKRAAVGFNVVTWTYHFGALAFGVATGFAVLALARPEVPLLEGVWVVVLTTTLSVLFGMGALHAHFRPFQWTVAIALATSAVTLVHLLGPNPFGLALYGSAAWALLAWLLLIPTFWFRRLIAVHRDLYITHLASAQTRLSLRGHTAHERHERLLGAMQRAARRTWKVSVGAALLVVAASTCGTWWVLDGLRPRPLEPALARFEAAWNANDLAAVRASLPAGTRGAASARLAGLVKGHGWQDALPPLSGGVTSQEQGGPGVDYVVGGAAVSTHWRRSGPHWVLASVEVSTPSVEPAFEAFLAAWRSSDLAAVASFFADDTRATMLANLERALDDRAWDSLPAFLGTSLGEQGTGADARLVLARGEVSLEWSFDVAQGAWRLTFLRLPKR